MPPRPGSSATAGASFRTGFSSVCLPCRLTVLRRRLGGRLRVNLGRRLGPGLRLRLLLVRALALAEDRQHPRDVLAGLLELARILQLLRHRLAPQIKEMPAPLVDLLAKLLGPAVPHLFQFRLHLACLL